jgi:hypothetical protein
VRIGGAPRGHRVRSESASSSVEGAAGLDVPGNERTGKSIDTRRS